MEFIQKLAPRVGITDQQVLNEAAELYRNIYTKTLAHINEIDKIVICLDLAAFKLGSKFDRDTAYTLLAKKKNVYNKCFTTVKNVLQIKELKSVHEICIKLSCEQASKSAERLFQKYKECDVLDRDFDHPQYVVAAVWVICWLNNIPIKKSDFVSLSTLTPKQWNKMVLEFTKFAEEHGFKADNMRKTTKKKGNEFMIAIEEKAREEQVKHMLKRGNSEQTKTESYEVWRKRILDEAYANVNASKV